MTAHDTHCIDMQRRGYGCVCGQEDFMEYLAFAKEQEAKNYAEQLTKTATDIAVERLYLPLHRNANRRGNVWVISMANPRGGRWHVQEDGHIG